MAKATTTIRQTLNHPSEHDAWFAANQALFNQVAAFYFDVIQAHRKILDLSGQEALTALEKLTHRTKINPDPVMPLSQIGQDIPALFRRAAIHAALGSARSFYAHLHTWQKQKEKAIIRGKTFQQRPPVPPRTWNKSATLYRGQWKERTASSIVVKVWTGTCWSWVKLRITGRELPTDVERGSPQLVQKGHQWWLHTPVERTFKRPGNIEKQITENAQTKICAVDLNLGENIAVCTIQTVEGSILATTFIGGGREITGFRKKLLGRIARNRSKTGIIAEGQQDNADLWKKLRQVDEQAAHLISARIVQWAQQHEASVLVFEHLGTLKPTKGTYSRRGNAKRAFWMKGRIFHYAKYKAWNQGIITSRVNPRNTSRECARCHRFVARYHTGQPAKGYTMGAPLVSCAACGMKGNADRNASLVIGQRVIARYQKEKPQTQRRGEKSPGVGRGQDANCAGPQPSTGSARQAETNEHGTAQGRRLRMDTSLPDIAHQLRFPFEL
jgi:transposase